MLFFYRVHFVVRSLRPLLSVISNHRHSPVLQRRRYRSFEAPFGPASGFANRLFAVLTSAGCRNSIRDRPINSSGLWPSALMDAAFADRTVPFGVRRASISRAESSSAESCSELTPMLCSRRVRCAIGPLLTETVVAHQGPRWSLNPPPYISFTTTLGNWDRRAFQS